MAKTPRRKTITVEFLKAETNAMLLNSVDSYERERMGACYALETILHATGNYDGFRYLSEDAMASSTVNADQRKVPGIAYPDGPDAKPIFPDVTRRRYY